MKLEICGTCGVVIDRDIRVSYEIDEETGNAREVNPGCPVCEGEWFIEVDLSRPSYEGEI
jgi:hypothetical protein